MLQAGPQDRTANRVFARAIKAVHDRFEYALGAEWDVRADSAKVRNAMQALPNRCLQCKKPAAGISGDICTCKGTMGTERCLSNPRNTLLELLRQRCQSVLASVSLAEFVEQITRIGVANGSDLEWVEGQIYGLRPSLSRACRKWIVGVCPDPFNYTGQLPAWLKKDDRVILEAELYRSLSSEDAEAELVLIEAQIALHFEEAERAALDQASIQMAQAVRLVPERAQRKRARQDITAAMIAKIKRDNPGWSIERICGLLDIKKCPLRECDRRAGFSSWHVIWKQAQYRNRIKRFISDILPAAAERKV
jgi:hypothetical protein